MSEEQSTSEKQLTLKEFNEINYDALHTLGVHYFAEILKENEILKKPIYLFKYIDQCDPTCHKYTHEIFISIRSHSLEEAYDKIIHNSYVFLKMFLRIFRDSLNWNHITKETNDYQQQLANLNIITENKNDYQGEIWKINENNEDFDKNYKKFIEQNYETLCKYFTENRDPRHFIIIHKFDKIL